MSNLTRSECRKLEKLLDMGSGYVLKFTDRTFRDFFCEYEVEIDAERYKVEGTSKAKRMRTFWKIEKNYIVGRVIEGLIEYSHQENWFSGDVNDALISDCLKIAQRLLEDQAVAELDSLTPISEDRDFEVVVKQIREALDRDQPEAVLDRLHTLFIKFIRTKLRGYQVDVDSNEPLHSLFGKYIRIIEKNGHLESSMSKCILKSTISVLNEFNGVRNNQSLAHDNALLNYEESLLIFNHIVAMMRFIKSLEMKIKAKAVSTAGRLEEDDLPF